MGRRSINTTKSGKYMNPTDQARKEARKKELKKNKRQRQLVRAAVLKNKDPSQILEEMEKIDEMEYNVLQPSPLNEKVLRDKRKKLKETFDRVMRLYHTDEPDEWTDLKRREVEYERKRLKKQQFYESVKHAQTVQIDEIPLPSTTTQPTPTTTTVTFTGPSRAPPPPPTALMLPPFAPGGPPGAPKKTTDNLNSSDSSDELSSKDNTVTGVPLGQPPNLFHLPELDSDAEDDEVVLKEYNSQSTKLAKTTIAANLSNLDEFMQEMENVHKKKVRERAAAAGRSEKLSSNDNSDDNSNDDDDDDDDDDNTLKLCANEYDDQNLHKPENIDDDIESKATKNNDENGNNVKNINDNGNNDDHDDVDDEDDDDDDDNNDDDDNEDDDDDEDDEQENDDMDDIDLDGRSIESNSHSDMNEDSQDSHQSASKRMRLDETNPSTDNIEENTMITPTAAATAATAAQHIHHPRLPIGTAAGIGTHMLFRPPPLRPPNIPNFSLRMPPGPPPGPRPVLGSHLPQRMGIRLPPGPPPGLPPRIQQIKNAPQNTQQQAVPKDAKGGSTTITAKPQIRNLSADVTRFVPSTLRVKRDEIVTQVKPARVKTTFVPEPPIVTTMAETTKAATKDDAYLQFMNEMQGLL